MANHLTHRTIVPRGEGRGAPLPRSAPKIEVVTLRETKTGVVEAPLSASLADVRAYVKVMDTAVDSLWADTKAQLVWIDPADVSKWGEDPELAARAIAHGPVRSAKEIDFARRVSSLRTVEWPAAKTGITLGMDTDLPGPGVTYATPSKRWNLTRAFHGRVADKFAEFRKLGGTPSDDPGPVPDEIDKTDPGFLAKKAAQAMPWWVWPAVIAGGGIAAYFYVIGPMLAARRASTAGT